MPSRENRGRALAIVLAAILLIGGPLFLWWDMYHRYEYVNERVADCTVTKLVHSDQYRDGYVETAQCGMLHFKPLRIGLESGVEAGHTYRLRIAELEPQYGPDITGILAVEGEAATP